MNRYTHPFDCIKTPEEVWEYLQLLLPEGDGWDSAAGLTAKNYVLAIARYYTADTTPRPECSVANVVATVSCKSLKVVLEMLKTCPSCQALVRPLLEACEEQSVTQVVGRLNVLRRPLERINFGTTAHHKVNLYLARYV